MELTSIRKMNEDPNESYYYISENLEESKDLLLLNDAERRLVVISLSAFSKYLGLYSLWKDTIKEFGLKWDKPNQVKEGTTSLENFSISLT